MKYLTPASDEEFSSVLGEHPQERRKQIATYMEAAPIVLRATTTMEHPLLPGEPLPVGHASDGDWVWPLGLPALIRRGLAAPDVEFVEHVLARSAPPTTLAPEVLEIAIDVAQSAG